MGRKRKLRRNKKGSIQDLVYIFVSLVAVAVVILIVFKISNELNTEFQGSSKVNARGKSAFNSINNMYPGVLDNSFLILAFGLGIVALVFAMMVRIHPVFLVFFIIILAVIIFVCGVFSNLYQEMANDPELVDVAVQLTFIDNIMTYLPFIIGVFGFLLAIVMYKGYQDAQ